MPGTVSILLWALLGAQVEMPKSLDSKIEFELVASEPKIVTPTGIAVDARGRVLVIESHTHFRPENYEGPPADRIRVFEDSDHDGRYERVSTFFEGTRWTMNLAVDGDGSVLVATRNEIFRLKDTDNDGRADRNERLAFLETPGTYPHNGLSGFAISYDGRITFGLGENLGADYKLIGSDGTTLSGGGEGGSIYRCNADGSGLERIATGFWNPFHVAFDVFGRLFAVDNDPDSRPPCRLLHVVEDGDYGYRFRNGRKGLHPFTSWNGELPGTLPMVAGTGEAPSGLVVYEADHLPAEYRGNVLATSWGDHRIERFPLKSEGASFRAVMEPLIVGGENFRPVGIAQAPDGSLFISDWVDKSYPLHGKGRVWHLKSKQPPERNPHLQAKPGTDAPEQNRWVQNWLRHCERNPEFAEWSRRHAAVPLTIQTQDLNRWADVLDSNTDPRVWAAALDVLAARGGDWSAAGAKALAHPSADVRAMAGRMLPARVLSLELLAEDESPLVRAEALRRIRDADALPALLKSLGSPDPFVAQAAREGLKHSLTTQRLLDLAHDDDPARRLGVLLVLRESPDPSAKLALPGFLDDADASIRFCALEWIADQRLAEYRPALLKGLAQGASTRTLFEAYLAALERLDGVARDPKNEQAGEEYVAQLLNSRDTAPAVRRRALRMLRPDYPGLTRARLKTLLADTDPALRLEAVRTLRESPIADRDRLLRDIATDTHQPAALRAEAVAGLSASSADNRSLLIELTHDPDRALQHAALRSLRGAMLSTAERAAIQELSASADRGTRALASQVLGKHGENRPAATDVAAWIKLLAEPGDAAEGERVFFHPQGPGCFKCHQVDGRGGRVGPDLSTTGQVLTEAKLIESIVQPSREVAPQFVPWAVASKDGRVFAGLLVDESALGDQTYVDAKGDRMVIKASEIESRRPQAGSIMPDDLVATMTLAELRDLIAYLRSPRAGESGHGQASRP